MSGIPLISFWMQRHDAGPYDAYGVTGYSLADALHILREFGIELPEDMSSFKIVEGVRVSDLDQNHVAPNIGPIVVRGVWYPLQKIGV
jgi:hypothetical protein